MDVETSAFYPFGYCELLADKKFQVIRRLVTDDEPGLRGQDARSAVALRPSLLSATRQMLRLLQRCGCLC